jgi:hypothetical protein
VSFRGNTDWQDAKDWGETPDEVVDALHESDLARNGSLPHGLEEAMDASGFEWWVETREARNA